MSKFATAMAQAEQERALGARTARREPALAERRPLDGATKPRSEASAAAGTDGRAREVEVRGDGSRSLDERLVTLLAPASFEAEQFLVPRHFIEQAQKEAGVVTLGVSSASMGEGKTLAAVNLAGALAQTPGSRVLLVDLDLRSSSVGELLGVDDTETSGLTAAMVDPALAPGDGIRYLAPFNLAVLPAGRRLSRSYELLKSPRLGELFEAWRRQYDLIVVDTPPILPFPDWRVVAKWIDGVLLVVRADGTRRAELVEALEILDSSKLLGLVWNDDDRHSAPRYAYVGDRDGRGVRRPSTV